MCEDGVHFTSMSKDGGFPPWNAFLGECVRWPLETPSDESKNDGVLMAIDSSVLANNNHEIEFLPPGKECYTILLGNIPLEFDDASVVIFDVVH